MDKPGHIGGHRPVPFHAQRALVAGRFDIGIVDNGIILLHDISPFDINIGKAHSFLIEYIHRKARFFQQVLEQLGTTIAEIAPFITEDIQEQTLLGGRIQRQRLLRIFYERSSLIGGIFRPFLKLFPVQYLLQSRFIRHQFALLLAQVQFQMRFQRQNPGHGFIQTFFCQNPLFQPVQHKPEVLGHIAVKEEHITTGGNCHRYCVFAAQGIGEAAHGRSIRDDKPIKAQMLT